MSESTATIEAPTEVPAEPVKAEQSEPIELSRDAGFLPLAGKLHGQDGAEKDSVLQVHNNGAVGKDQAQEHCPPYGCIQSANRTYIVKSHEPHPGGHENFVVPHLEQIDGDELPGQPDPITMHHVEKMDRHSKEWGVDSQTHFRPDGKPDPSMMPMFTDYQPLEPEAPMPLSRAEFHWDGVPEKETPIRFDAETGKWA